MAPYCAHSQDAPQPRLFTGVIVWKPRPILLLILLSGGGRGVVPRLSCRVGAGSRAGWGPWDCRVGWGRGQGGGRAQIVVKAWRRSLAQGQVLGIFRVCVVDRALRHQARLHRTLPACVPLAFRLRPRFMLEELENYSCEWVRLMARTSGVERNSAEPSGQIFGPPRCGISNEDNR